MTTNEINRFRNMLEARVQELGCSTRRRDVIRVEDTADDLDRRLRASERELAGKTLEADAAKLRDTRAALDRIQNGSFGICTECEEPVSPLRLNAIPWASLCIHCQQAVEPKSSKGGRYTLPMAA